MMKKLYAGQVSRARVGFTLVELLVVIGIIALLISILLPSLNRAREAARAIKCAANLKSIGNSMMIYVQDNRGMLPIGFTDGTVDMKTGHGNGFTAGSDQANKLKTNWAILLANSTDRKLPTNAYEIGQARTALTGGFQVYQCPSAPPSAAGLPNQLVYHYSAHPRLFMYFKADNGSPAGTDPATGSVWTTTKIASVRRSSDMATVFDGSLQQASNGTMTVVYDCPSAYGLDHAKIIGNNEQSGNPNGTSGFGTTWLTTTVTPSYGATSFKLSDPVTMNGYYNKPLSTFNTDTPDNAANIRFRHGSNNVANVLMLDGHVQTFNYNKTNGIPDLLRRNVCVGP